MRELWTLFSVFFRIGLFTVGGGGYAMLPMLRREIVERYGWLTDADLLNIYAIGQSTPGVIAVNTATFVGYRRRGICGSLAATAGIVTPSLLIISLISIFFAEFREIELVARAFAGIRIAVAVMLIYIVAGLFKKAAPDIFSLLVLLLAFLLVAAGILPVVWTILGGGVAGMLYYPLREQMRAAKLRDTDSAAGKSSDKPEDGA